MRNLQTAWEAIEKGDHVEAQSLVAQILRDDPRNAEAWMILGEAVSEDRDRHVLFLRKALQLNPDLEPAQERLAELEAADETDEEPAEANLDLPPVPPDVSLDAPTVPIAERVNASRSAPQQTNLGKTNAGKEQQKKSNLANNLLLIIVGLGILVTIFFLIQNIAG